MLSLGALGVVYGDIGTSPLYAMKECFSGSHGVPVTPENVLGVTSLVFWSLFLVVVVKYLSFVMLADNHGEGGTFALLALLTEGATKNAKSRAVLVALAIFGAALLYGDGMITPAISVLSAIEGLQVATDTLQPYVVPITVVIIVLIFWVQRKGTAGIGAVFGPITLLWFVTLAVIGTPWILREPAIFGALNPVHALRFFVEHGLHGFLVLGAVVLCVTGGEALYADMGHFGKKPIRLAWYAAAYPGLLLNYFGQGALLLSKGQAGAENPFYSLISGWQIYPVVAIATAATVVASQALISGAFSLTNQAVQLGFCPRVTIVHTSGKAEGQIYVPEVNYGLMVSCVALVIGFGESSDLAAAYGIAVTGTMAITSVLFFAVMYERWGVLPTAALTAMFLVVDLAFFGANVAKIAHGGWFPLVVAAVLFILMTTWKRGRAALGQAIRDATLPRQPFLDDIERQKPHRVPGTAIFMTSNPEGVPPALLHFFKHAKVFHEKVVLLSVLTEHVPTVSRRKRVEIKDLGQGFFHVTGHYGFMQTPRVKDVLRQCIAAGLEIDRDDCSFFLGRETLLPTGRSGMMRWRKAIFVFLSRNARSAAMFFGLPPNRVVELGLQIEI